MTWKSTVGTNVASDALSNLASAGVIGGALIVVGEDYGEGASIIQERTPRLRDEVLDLADGPAARPADHRRLVEKAFELSEASNTPVMMELRIRACHVTGEFAAKDNMAPAISRNHLLAESGAAQLRPHLASALDLSRRRSSSSRCACRPRSDFIVEQGLNELFPGELDDIGIIVQGGLNNVTAPRAAALGLADAFGGARCRRWC